MAFAEDKEYEGLISGVTEWGLYVEIIETKCEGMIRLAVGLDDVQDLKTDLARGLALLQT